MAAEVEERVVISLQRYEKLKKDADRGEISQERLDEIRRHFSKASSELGQFLNHLAKKIDNIQELVDAFNSSSENSSIIYSEDKDRYYIEVNEEEDNE